MTKGFSIWCSAVTERFASCQVSEAAMTIYELPDIITSHFFIEMGTVQFGIWTSLVLNVFLLALASRKVFVFHERANIAVSMAKERLRYSGAHWVSQNSWPNFFPYSLSSHFIQICLYRVNKLIPFRLIILPTDLLIFVPDLTTFDWGSNSSRECWYPRRR